MTEKKNEKTSDDGDQTPRKVSEQHQSGSTRKWFYSATALNPLLLGVQSGSDETSFV